MDVCRKILVVDDDQSIREALKTFLEYEGFEVTLAVHGREALDILNTNEKFCLILLDLMMPVMSGWEFAQALEKEDELNHIPIVVLSAFIDRAKGIKARGLLGKPFDIDKLMEFADECCCR